MMMLHPRQRPTRRGATASHKPLGEKRISEIIMMGRSWKTQSMRNRAGAARKPLAGKRNSAFIIMGRVWTTPRRDARLLGGAR